jgi:hypothetical protein
LDLQTKRGEVDMPKARITKTLPLLAAAAVISAAGSFAAAVPAQALPPFPLAPGDCQQWGFPGPVTLIQSTGEVLTFNSTGPTASGPAPLKQGGPTKQGSITGAVDPNGHINLTWIQDSNNGTVAFNGDVGPDGNAKGTRDPNNEVTWRSGGPMTCAQTAPKEGPTISFDPVLGGLVAHITDRSGVTSQCEYHSDFYSRTFRLEKNSTFDLKIVPAIPLLQDRPIDITCDNGTNTHTSTFF